MKLKLYAALILTSLVLVSGCNVNNDSVNNKPEDKVSVEKEVEKDEYNKDLASIFPTKIGTTWNYNGLAEYGHIMSLKDIVKDDNNNLLIKIQGYLNDGQDDPDPNGDRTFNIEYVVNKDSIKEYIVYNEKNTLEDTLYSSSIIPEKIILKGPLEVGNSWEEEFKYKDKTYKAKTTITEIKLNKDEYKAELNNKKAYTTRTVVENIEGFKDNTYLEERVHIQGVGLTSFQKTMENEEYYEGEEFNFGYGLSVIE